MKIPRFSFEIFIILLVCSGPTAMYFAYKGMYEEKTRLEDLGYSCVRGKEQHGPSHTRDTMYLCAKGSKRTTVGVWGRNVKGRYKLKE